MEIDPEIEQVEQLIKEFISVITPKTLKEVALDIDNFKNGEINHFNKKRANYSLGDKKLIQDEINSIEERYKQTTTCEEIIMANGFNSAVTNSSEQLKYLYATSLFNEYNLDEDFKNLQVLHVCSLYSDPFRLFGKKIKDLSAPEIDFEILMYIIMGINDCFYLQWLYGELENIGDRKKQLPGNKKEEIPKVESLSFIVPNKQEVFLKYESKIEDLTDKWRSNNDKTTCAVFCIFLYSNGFFKDNKKVEDIKAFAENRYGFDFGAAIKRMREDKNKDDLKSRTEKLKRDLLNIKYGKV